MKTIKYTPFLLALGLVFGVGACTEDKLDEIDTNPNTPTDSPVQLLLPQVEVDAAFGISGTDLAWISSVFVEHTTGVHAQFENLDKRAVGSFTNNTTSNNWNDIYAGELVDLNLIIQKGSDGGSEAGAWRYVGIAKVLKAYTLGITTDLFGRIPYSEALQGDALLKPVYDKQQDIYTVIDDLLTDAIVDLDKTSSKSPTNADLFYGGDAAKWKKVAYSLKARYYNHLSKRDPAGSADKALAAAAQGFASPADNFTFTKYTTAAIGQNPWYQEQNDRGHFAVSATFYSILQNGTPTVTADDDPRIPFLVDPVGRNASNPRVAAPNGTAIADQGGTTYSRISTNIVDATSAQPLMTYAELKFIEAEAQLRKGNATAAYDAYVAGVNADLNAKGGSTYTNSTSTNANVIAFRAKVFMGASNLTLRDIITQKYVAAFPYMSIESYNDYRRTGFPVLNNPKGPAPRRFPYPQSEIDTNGDNVPNVPLASGVWWDDGTED
ncbi:SusD/RagB family nutrient-binding outer membrane lipoprotein [Hymenobacter profundi]|uniref:SusD/RagB family nutrient-binding outer membrane lipoprotein n=1 Tax=Hymenobacter profundi TaxID=1982110 RepID=A0ABS6WW91_9BACT|nr:SusD/RagB family nutrient-binding outer membrane lipoprotein [Hymenobacter profundi]MBW3127870.1 SusD/RagB family nutrient-binding outer membrane lipoprotein [Hymenobacter profundi]